MLKLKRIICLLSFMFLFDTYDVSIITPFNALAADVLKNQNKEMIHKNNVELKESSIDLQSEKMEEKKFISEKIKQEELIKKKEEEEKKNEPEWREFILTFYTSLESENSSAGPVTCQNKPLSRGGVANNVIPQNTKLYLEGYGQVTVNDRGSDKYFGVDNRLDVFIPRECGENDRQYSKRVNSYGVQKVKGYVVKNKK